MKKIRKILFIFSKKINNNQKWLRYWNFFFHKFIPSSWFFSFWDNFIDMVKYACYLWTRNAWYEFFMSMGNLDSSFILIAKYFTTSIRVLVILLHGSILYRMSSTKNFPSKYFVWKLVDHLLTGKFQWCSLCEKKTFVNWKFLIWRT